MATSKLSLAAVFSMGFAILCGGRPADAAIITLGATLTGAQEIPANASLATGTGTILLNDVAQTITVNESWSGLGGPASASHIHTGAIGVSGAVTFPFTGVPAATAGSIPQQVFSVTPAQITALETGGMYFNVHSSTFASGEIRGQITIVPEPASLGLLGVGAMALLARRRGLMRKS